MARRKFSPEEVAKVEEAIKSLDRVWKRHKEAFSLVDVYYHHGDRSAPSMLVAQALGRMRSAILTDEERKRMQAQLDAFDEEGEEGEE